MATILIVDDSPANRDFLATLLEYDGHRLLQAGDGIEALTLAQAEPPDLIIADILMPTMDGYELVRQLRSDPRVAHTPVIFWTAHYHERDARVLARRCGVLQVLTKPTEPEAVLNAVEPALGATSPMPTSSEPVEEFDREHVRLLTNKLSRRPMTSKSPTNVSAL
jgi:CheY-like chemotaxis protein